MDAFFVDFLDRLEALHKQFAHDVADLPEAAMDWVPGEALNSVAVIVAHSMGSESFWIGQMAAGEDVGRVRATEFETRGKSQADLLALIDQATANAQRWVSTLTLDDLATQRTSPAHERTFSVAWSLLHALDHSAEHLGHLGITRQLWKLHAAD